MNDETTLKDSVTAVDASLTESIQRPSVGDGDGNGDGTEHRIRTGDDNNQDQEASNDVPATTSIGDGDGGEGGNEHGGDGDGDGTELRLPCPKLSLPALKIDASFHDNDVTSFRHNFSSVLRQHNNYTLIPASAKVVVFDSELPVKHAFAALIEHDIKCAPVWNSERRDFEGMITVTDFIDVLLQFYHSEDYDHGEFANRLGDYTVLQWNEIKRGRVNPSQRLLFVTPDQTIYDTVRMFCAFNVHRLPILDKEPENRVLSILNHQRILRYVLTQLEATGHSGLLDSVRIGDLEVGTLGDSCFTVPESAPLIDVLSILKKHRLPAVPIISEDGHYIDAYTRSDVRLLALDMTYDRLDMSVKEAIAEHRAHQLIPTCSFEDSLRDVFSRVLSCRKHCSVVLDESKSVLGIISLAEIFQFILDSPDEQDESSSPREKSEDVDDVRDSVLKL